MDLEFTFERLKGFCRDCGLLEHDLGDCDKGLRNKLVKAKEVPPTQALASLSLCAPTIFSGRSSSALTLQNSARSSGGVHSSPTFNSSTVDGLFGSDQTRSGLLASGLLRDLGR